MLKTYQYFSFDLLRADSIVKQVTVVLVLFFADQNIIVLRYSNNSQNCNSFISRIPHP